MGELMVVGAFLAGALLAGCPLAVLLRWRSSQVKQVLHLVKQAHHLVKQAQALTRKAQDNAQAAGDKTDRAQEHALQAQAAFRVLVDRVAGYADAVDGSGSHHGYAVATDLREILGVEDGR